MREWLLCLVQILAYGPGMLIVCGLAVEMCYQLCFRCMGRRAGRFFWYLTAIPGTPVHETGHALMCLVFAHRIDQIRLFPTRAGNACVVHSYNKRNPYATFGNLWIGLGPLFSGLGVIFLVLHFIFPVSLQAYVGAITVLLHAGAPAAEVGWSLWDFLRGLATEATRPLWLRLFGGFILFSMAMHIRLSAADVRGMLPGVPGLLLLCALISGGVTLIFSTEGIEMLCAAMARLSWLIIGAFLLILIFALLQLLAAALLRLLVTLLLGRRART